MSIKEELDKLQCELLSIEEMLDIFGEKFKDNLIKDVNWGCNYDLLFEEDGKLYLVSLLEYEEENDFELIKSSNSRFYEEVNEKDFTRFQEFEKMYKNQLLLFDKIFSHKNYRIKRIFKKG